MNRQKAAGPVLKYLAAIIILPIVGWELYESFSADVVVYPVGEDLKIGTYCLNRSVYRADPDGQSIIYWWPGIQEVPAKLVKCIVRDKENWVGFYPDSLDKVEMVGGVIQDKKKKQVSKYYWWYLYFK